MNSVIIWFRRDLRLRDNPALRWAHAQGRPVVAIYIDSPDEEAPWTHGAASRWWLQQSLQQLAGQLHDHGIPLHFFQGNAAEVLEGLGRDTGSTTIACNALPEPHLQQRDLAVQRQLARRGVELVSFDAEHLLRPATLLNQQGKPYKVFTPFWKRLRSQLHGAEDTLAAAQALPTAAARQPAGMTLDALGLCAGYPWHAKLHAHWSPGEQQAWQRADAFLDAALAGYPDNRDRPALDGTARLSPHLHFGEITAPQLLRELWPLLDGAAATASGAEAFLRQLGWREFARYVLWHFPHTAQQPMDSRFTDAFWQMDESLLQAWQQGRTGVPIIDAGMRELWDSGWMHNRVRMLVASFLTKNLGLPWQAGARWFWDTLVDADLANNSLGWQWVAGCGVDAAPYFRIFNPLTQAERFDPDARYCERWLDSSSSDRPLLPLVDLKASRQLALERYTTQIKTRRTQ